MYGTDSRYNIPVFSPAPVFLSDVLVPDSATALHMEHCAEAGSVELTVTARINAARRVPNLIFMSQRYAKSSESVVRGYHQVHDHPRNGDIQPDRP